MSNAQPSSATKSEDRVRHAREDVGAAGQGRSTRRRQSCPITERAQAVSRVDPGQVNGQSAGRQQRLIPHQIGAVVPAASMVAVRGTPPEAMSIAGTDHEEHIDQTGERSAEDDS